MVVPYLETEENIVKEFNPKTQRVEDSKEWIIHLFDSFGDEITYKFDEETKFLSDKDYFEKLIERDEI